MMPSPLYPIQFNQAPNYGEQLLGAVAQGQGIQQNAQALRANEQSMNLQQQQANQQLTEVDYQNNLRKLTVLRNLASNARKLPEDQRQQFLMNGSVALESLGYTPEQIASQPLDDRSLDQYVSQLDSVIPRDQQAQYRKESVSTSDGLKVYDPVDGTYTTARDENGRPLTAAQYDASLQQDLSASRARGGLETRQELEPQLQADITSAKARATAEAAKVVKQQGQLDKLEDADRLYKSLGDSDLDLIYGKGERWYPEYFRSQKGTDLIAQRDQLVGMINLAARGQLSGQGAVSDTEAKAILESATTLANPNISPNEARIALDAAMRQIYGNAGKKFEKSSPTGINPNESQPDFSGWTIKPLD